MECFHFTNIGAQLARNNSQFYSQCFNLKQIFTNIGAKLARNNSQFYYQCFNLKHIFTYIGAILARNNSQFYCQCFNLKQIFTNILVPLKIFPTNATLAKSRGSIFINITNVRLFLEKIRNLLCCYEIHYFRNTDIIPKVDLMKKNIFI